MRKKFLFIAALGALIMACNFLIPTPTPKPTQEATAVPATEAPSSSRIAAKLEELGGAACEENPDFTCVTIQVPLDHFDAVNTETLDVVFAVSPATGERLGMFVQAFPGGPGGEGVSTGGLGWYSDGILEHYDIVYFDQRGVGLSSPLACAESYADYFLGYLDETDQSGLEGYDTTAEQQAAVDQARAFVESCVTEIGIDPAKLGFYGTDQVAEDIESFRQAVGDEKFWLYGVSYGTAVAQTYAAAHSDHLAGLILDGTIDLTLTGEEGAFAQEEAFNKVLLAALQACNQDETCAAEFSGDAIVAYDKLAESISKTPMTYEFPLPSGKTVKRTFTFHQLDFTTSYQMYSLSGRMFFLRALAAANKGDIIPMARLFFQQASFDPESGTYQGDSTFSDTMYYSVWCTDDSYYSGTSEERSAKLIEAGQSLNGIDPRLDLDIYPLGLACAFWPSASATVIETPPLRAEGVTTFVLNSTLDPATPFEEGKAVYENLADGYHLYVEGGRHSIYGFGYDCPDKYITDFMVDGTLPSERELVCEDWGTDVTRAYEPLIAKDASAFADVLETFHAIDSEIQLQPEYFYGSFTEDVSVACPFGGSFTFGPGDVGEAFTFENCSFVRDFALTGSGSNDYDNGIITFETQVGGVKEGNLVYTDNLADGTLSVTGEYGGETIDLSK